MVRPEHANQCGELVRCEHDCIDINSFEIRRGRLRQCAVTIGTRSTGMIDTSRISTKVSAAMHRQDFESRMTIANAIEYQVVQRDRCLERITDDIVKVKPCQPRSVSETIRMDHHHGAELFRFLPERCEC